MLWLQALHSRCFHLIVKRTLCSGTIHLRLVSRRWSGCRFLCALAAVRPVDNSTTPLKENFSEKLQNVVEKVGLLPADVPVLRQALTSKSFSEVIFATRRKQGVLVETLEPDLHNERLAVLGEASVRLAVSEHLNQHMPDLAADSRKHILNYVVQPSVIAPHVDQLGLLPLVRSKHPLSAVTDTQPLAVVFLAVVGAISSTKGQLAAAEFVKKNLALPEDEETLVRKVKVDRPVLMLEMLCKKVKGSRPSSRITRQPPDDTTFAVSVFDGSKELGAGTGYSVQEAEAEACLNALVEEFSGELLVAPFPGALKDFHPDHDISLIEKTENFVKIGRLTE